MKKILVIVAGLVSAAVIGTVVSTLQRYTGINLSSLFSTGSIALIICIIALSNKEKKNAN
jgi:type III secretory pathway component EscS